MIKKLSILFLTVLCFLYCSFPILASNSNEFINDYWLNTNGYWLLPRKQIYNGTSFHELNYFPIYGRQSTQSTMSYGSCYFVMDNGKYKVSGDTTGTSMCAEWQGMTVSINISNYYKQLSATYNSTNKDKIINTLNAVGFLYEDNGIDTINYYSPDSYVYYRFDYDLSQYYEPAYSNENCVYIYDYDDNGNRIRVPDYDKNNKASFLTGGGNSLSETYYRAYGYRINYKLSTDYNSIEPNFKPIIYGIIEEPKLRGKYASYMIRANGDLISTHMLPSMPNGNSYSAFTWYPLYNPDSKKYNKSGRYGLNASFMVGIIPPSNESSNLHDLIENLKLKKYPVTDVQFMETMFTNGGVGDSLTSFYNNGLETFIDFSANRQTQLPLTYSNYVYNQFTYWNNKNNYYWWSILNYNPDGGGDLQEPDNSTPDNPSGGGSGGGSGSGGDGNITIDTQNIENLLQQILETLQNQSSTDVDLTEIENLLNAIKNNLKDYTGDLTTINNSLTLINQFLSNNINVPLSDLKTLLTDIKTLSEYQKEQLTGISAVLHDMKQLFIDIYNRLGEIKDKIGGTINNIEEGTNLWDVLKALIDNLGNFLSSGLELFEKLLIPQGTFQTDFNSTIAGIQDKLGVLYQPVDVFSNFLTNLYSPTETSTLADSGHIIKIPEAKYDGVTIIEAQSIDLDETVEKSGLKPLYDVYLLIVDMIVLFGILNLAFKKFHDIISENGGDYK